MRAAAAAFMTRDRWHAQPSLPRADHERGMMHHLLALSHYSHCWLI